MNIDPSVAAWVAPLHVTWNPGTLERDLSWERPDLDISVFYVLTFDGDQPS